MDDSVAPEEPIARFLRNGSHMRPSVDRPHFSGFLPRDPHGDISVYRTVGLDGSAIRTLGDSYVAKPDSPLKGYCVLEAGRIFQEGLAVVPHPVPHERHANVVGWTSDPRNRIIAKKLADAAVLYRY